MSQHTPNPQQQKIIDRTNGAILVLAPVGSGKTLVLSSRVVRAVSSHDNIPKNIHENNHIISGEKILCLTFTNRAAKEMSERLMQAVPDVFHKITIKTFHGLCASILRSEAREIGLPTDFVIYDETDCKEIIKEVFGFYHHKDVDKTFFEITNYKSHLEVSKLSANFSNIELFADIGSENQARLVAKYQEILQQRHAVDFSDLVFYVRVMFHHQK
ncbi:MAG: UvrD-helicase domain-containing protein, partial [Calothrix sp. SM1_7_51]|nr:UvrD-helicase domain-containing protein [Calothrix sp. SM1_7_51]